ncbi:MAG: hypothetical protein ACTJH9_06715 [Pseudoalteromonas sp.]|uniref:hypothetical protein n=1 Tax=unclassified Pseudoalteromonas TaxID=194690 RepID=UPI003F9DAC7D
MKISALATLINTTLLFIVGTSFSPAAGEALGAKYKQPAVIHVTARKRIKKTQKLPVAVSALIPSLIIESLFCRPFLHFCVIILGKCNVVSSSLQPVSLGINEIVPENFILKVSTVFYTV